MSLQHLSDAELVERRRALLLRRLEECAQEPAPSEAHEYDDATWEAHVAWKARIQALEARIAAISEVLHQRRLRFFGLR